MRKALLDGLDALGSGVVKTKRNCVSGISGRATVFHKNLQERGDLVQNRLVSGKPLDRTQIVRSKPGRALRFQQLQSAGNKSAFKALHRKVKVRVVPFNVRDFFARSDFRRKLLADFSDKRLLGRFARLNLSARKFPPALPVAIAPCRGKDLPSALRRVAEYHCGDDAEGFHLRSLGVTAFVCRF